MQNDGLIDVSAARAIYQGTGGGSGGSIYIECDLLTGKGTFTKPYDCKPVRTKIPDIVKTL